ncbi:MAG: calcium-binding protein [Nitrospirales bacterium]|nr:calcium-binding protein [Nitrospirales bacterium]
MKEWNMEASVATIDGGAGNDTLNGNSGADIINGYAGNDLMYGYGGNDTLNGGTGADSMLGGTGNDTYYVDNAGDVVTENAAEGTDLVFSSITYALTANVENLTLTGTANRNGTGNGLNNIITGNSGVNTLSGGAGNDILSGDAGADTMLGGAEDDYYVVDNTGDVITEAAGEGRDSVISSLSYTLGANVENLTLNAAAVNGTGNVLDNIITGNSLDNSLDGGAGNDVLTGLGGNDTLKGGSGNDALFGKSGNDTLIGGAGDDILHGGDGSDIFVFLTADSSMDVMTDFTTGAGNDILDLTALGITDDIGHLAFINDETNTHVMVDLNGGGDSYREIALLLGVDTSVGTDNYLV